MSEVSLVCCLQVPCGCCCPLSSHAASASASSALLGRCRLLPFAAASETALPAAAASLDVPDLVRAEGTPSLLHGAGVTLRGLLTGVPAGKDLRQHIKNLVLLQVKGCQISCKNLPLVKLKFQLHFT